MKPLKTISIWALAMVCGISSIFAQKGKLLIIGGGTERDTPNGWSNAAYQWAVNQSVNKKVAILNADASFTPTSFLTTYFTQSLGASAAKDFTFGSSAAANQAGVYDSLMKYDVIFLRGGDQSRYYTFYKGTELERALKDKFRQGGVLAGTSAGLHVLSGVVYTALNSSIRSPEALSQKNSTNLTLSNDFLGLFPGYVFDSHFHERGRFGRLIGFLARWKTDNNEKITGIGIDDLTAMGIDSNQVGTVFGTGAACIYTLAARRANAFYPSTKVLTDSISVKHVLNGWTYNFKKDSMGISAPLAKVSTSQPIPSKLYNTVFVSGADGFSQNSVLISMLSTLSGIATILTSTDTTEAFSYKNQLNTIGKAQVHILSIPAFQNKRHEWMATITNTSTFLVVNSRLSEMKSFLDNDSLGQQLQTKWNEGGNTIAFVGGNARMAGKRMLGDNYLTTDAAYSNSLRTSEGLGVIPNTIIFPQTFISDASGENGYAGVTYALLTDSLRYGWWLHGDMVGLFKVKPNGDAEVSSAGTMPMVVMEHSQTRYAFNTKTSRGDGSQQPRQVSGFNQMYVHVVDTSFPLVVAKQLPYVPPRVSSIATFAPVADMAVTIFPNPCDQELFVTSGFRINRYSITSLDGKEYVETKDFQGKIDTTSLQPGMYFVLFQTENKVIRIKFAKI